jgi:hypothetical protein
VSKPAKKIIPAGHRYVKENVLKKHNLTGVSESKALWAKGLNLPEPRNTCSSLAAGISR